MRLPLIIAAILFAIVSLIAFGVIGPAGVPTLIGLIAAGLFCVVISSLGV